MGKPGAVKILPKGREGLNIGENHSTTCDIVHATKLHSRKTFKLVNYSRSTLQTSADYNVRPSRSAAKVNLEGIDDPCVRCTPVLQRYEIVKWRSLCCDSLSRFADLFARMIRLYECSCHTYSAAISTLASERRVRITGVIKSASPALTGVAPLIIPPRLQPARTYPPRSPQPPRPRRCSPSPSAGGRSCPILRSNSRALRPWNIRSSAVRRSWRARRR